MRLDQTFMRSVIVRRIVGGFVVVALLPLGAAAALSLDAVRNLLLEQSRVRLAITADDYAAALHDRLLAIDGRLDELARPGAPAVGTGNGGRDRLKVEFKALGITDDAGAVTSIFGDIDRLPPLDAMQANRLAHGGTILASAGDGRTRPRLFARTRVAATPGIPRSLVAEIDPAYLWRRPSDSAEKIVVCVGDGASRLLSCKHCRNW